MESTRPIADQSPPLFDGRYQFVRELGRGGFGRVMLMRDMDSLDKRLVALKLLDPGFTDPLIVEYFRHEVFVHRDLGHPHIPRVLNDRRTPAGEFYFTMDFVEGRTLEELLKAEAPLTVARSLRLLSQLFDVLQHTHQRGVIHRDLKPGNIILADAGTPREQVKVLDFGVAKIRDDPNAPRSTSTVVGTRDYMSPEQVVGGEIDVRSDLFAVGVISYRMLTGRFPFEGANASIRRDRRLDATAMAAGPGIPIEIEQFIARLLQRDRLKRPSTEECVRIVAALRGEPEPIAATPLRRRIAAGGAARRPTSNKPLVAVGAGLALAAALSLVAVKLGWIPIGGRGNVGSDVAVAVRNQLGVAVTGLAVLHQGETLGITDVNGTALVRLGGDVSELSFVDQSPTPCYGPETYALSAQDRQRGRCNIVLNRKCSNLALRSDARGARVFLDGTPTGQTIGTAPLRFESLTPGAHAVRLEIDGRAVGDTSIALLPGEELLLALNAKRASNGTIVQPSGDRVPATVPAPVPAFEKDYALSTSPTVAQVFVDGEATSSTDGFGRANRRLKAGTHRFLVRTPEGDVTMEYRVQAGDPNNTLILDFQTGRVQARP